MERNRTVSYFVDVPAGASALQVNLSGIATGSQTRWIAIDPYGIPQESTASTACYSNYSDAAACNPQSRAYANPVPGVWEFELEARRTTPSLANPFTLTAVAQGVTVEPSTVELPSVAAGVASPVAWTATNQFGPITVTPQGGAFGSSFTDRPAIAELSNWCTRWSCRTAPPASTWRSATRVI